MDRYFRYFRVPFIITAVIIVVCLGIYIPAVNSVDYERNNAYYDNSWQVYDMADKLSDSEEEALNDLIQEWQAKSCIDIAVVTLDDADLGYLSAVHEFADEFTEETEMGFYGPMTASAVFVDNWSRGGDGKIHSWISTTGAEVRSRLTDDDCDDILNVLDEIENDNADPYYQYREIVEKIGKEAAPVNPPFSFAVVLLVALVVSGIYIAINWRSKVGDKTVTSGTYLKDGKASFSAKEDVFRNKVVTKHKIESSSSSGGGGGSHGGGGHSR